MRRFFRRAAPYAAGALFLATLPFPPKRKSPPAAGHLGLASARPGLEGLGAALTREALLIDAAYALGASVFRVPILTAPDMTITRKVVEVFTLVYLQVSLSVLLRTKPLSASGARTGEVLAQAERELARVEAEGDARAAADVNLLLLALLAARDGDFDEALGRYAQAVRADPSDLRPYILAAKLCRLTGWRRRWRSGASHLRGALLHDAAPDEAELRKLLDELAVAVALEHGAITAVAAPGSTQRGAVMLAAWREVDAGTATLLQGKELPLKQRLLIRAIWAFFRSKLKPWLAMAEQERF
uniref:Uncharacterized protein n=1 Tax=Setaria viridis TaxID=4556 RepID=A0A4U6UFN7_SETVI|nr:LOW QUALITY PROTEIN: hypothetical protein SEVIR_5G189300v2 [Setaria viridis]